MSPLGVQSHITCSFAMNEVESFTVNKSNAKREVTLLAHVTNAMRDVTRDI